MFAQRFSRKAMWVLIASCVLLALPLSAFAIIVPGGWTKYAGNPVFDVSAAGNWDDTEVFDPAVLFDGTTYRMWYTGANAAFTMRLGYATSSDGLSWTRAGGNPVLITGTLGSWDAKSVRFAAVISDTGQYKMWYTGLDAANIGRVGYATSADGLLWNKYGGNPVVNVGASGSWDATYVGMPTVIKVGSTYEMWYRGGNATGGGIGYATSPDGLAWTEYSGNPVIHGGSGSWDDTAYAPQVVFDGHRYHMWYSGCDTSGNICQVGYAISDDGKTWSKRGLVLPQGTVSDFDRDSADYPAVILAGSTFKMWYSGADLNAGKYRIGYATTPALNLDKSVYLPFIKR